MDANVGMLGAAVDRDGRAFESWARPSLPAMSRLARRLAPHDDPADVVQDALVRAWQQWHRFDASRGTPTTWLLAIVADRARAHRVGRLRRSRLVDEYAAVPDGQTDSAGARDLDLEKAVRRLSVRQQLAVDLVYFVGLTVAEAAAVMQCSPGTVKSTLFDARARLRDLLGDDDD